MYNSILSIGDKIDLSPAINQNEKSVKGKYISQIMDFVDDQQISITIPIDKGRLVLLDIGNQYDLYFYTKHGLYYSRCVVTSRSKIGNIFYASLKVMTELEKYQRRQFFRLDCLIDVTYRVISDQEINDIITYNNNQFSTQKEKMVMYEKLIEYDKEYQEAVAIDISGGGMRFTNSHPIEKGKKIMLRMELCEQSKEKKMRIMANVVLSSRTASIDKIKYEHRVEYYGISKEDRDFIVKYIFFEERKRRKKEKG